MKAATDAPNSATSPGQNVDHPPVEAEDDARPTAKIANAPNRTGSMGRSRSRRGRRVLSAAHPLNPDERNVKRGRLISLRG